MKGIIPQGRAAGYDTMLFRRSFGSRVVPEARAEERSRQNELVHSSHFAWESTFFHVL